MDIDHLLLLFLGRGWCEQQLRALRLLGRWRLSFSGGSFATLSASFEPCPEIVRIVPDRAPPWPQS